MIRVVAAREKLDLRRVTAFSKGIIGIPHLGTLLGTEEFVPRAKAKLEPQVLDAVVGWGYKATATRARIFAARHHVPYVALEDGFLRSVGAAFKLPPISIVLDDLGIYYEARQPSRLEWLIGRAGNDPGLIATGREARAKMIALRLSKYNVAATATAEAVLGRRRRVILVDQTFNDQAVTGAGAGARSFRRMLDTALERFAAADIVVKSHPDVVAGRTRGYLEAEARARGVAVVAENVDPYDLLDFVDEVWTVSSGLGFEAILVGKPVRCFGAPFYAGWGITDDSGVEPRAQAWLKRRSPGANADSLAAAALVAYPRYGDPVRFEPLHVLTAMDRLAEWREKSRNPRDLVGVGLGPEKRRIAQSIFGGGPGRLVFAKADSALAVAEKAAASLLVWTDRIPAALEAEAQRRDVGVVRFAKSVLKPYGLETPFVPLPAVAVDDVGLHLDASRPSRFEALVASTDFSPLLVARGRALRERYLAIEARAAVDLGTVRRDIAGKAGQRPVVLVVGEPAGSPAVRLGTTRVANTKSLLAAVRAERPDAFLVYFEAAEDASRRRGGWLPAAVLREGADHLIRDDRLAGLLDLAEEVHVMTSQHGFDAVMAGMRVVAWGAPFYAGWGLTEDREPIPRRARRLDADQLAAVTFALYTRYIDPVSGIPCEAEDYFARIETLRRGRFRSHRPPGLLGRILQIASRARQAIRIRLDERHGA
ncbi:capsular polysaccharide export protein, LipB/KpsS family [Prosthecomicrobium sp. N25]|uniref:capsular polysaccharide export protein, LipB/KpsS family n=1 Tax=Prosthecomicrobium sp. N25 TaxID=3129254 RepID=UPI0030773BE8